MRFTFLLFAIVFSMPLHAQESGAQPLVERALAAIGGREKMLTLFRIQETFHFGAEPEPEEGKKRASRESVIEPPKYWWLGKKERADEPAKYDVWVWTLGILTDPASQLEMLPDMDDAGTSCQRLRVSGSVTPAMDLWFAADTHLLQRLDWRGDFYRFSEWKEHDGVKYASRTIIYKIASGKPWFFHDVTGVQRLTALPEGLVRD